MDKQALVISTTGETQVIDIAEDTLSMLQGAVGGWVQAIDISPDVTMWLNEEGKLEGLPHNPTAQSIFDSAFGPGQDYLVGNVVLTGGVDEEGDTLGLTTEHLQSLGLAI